MLLLAISFFCFSTVQNCLFIVFIPIYIIIVKGRYIMFKFIKKNLENIIIILFAITLLVMAIFFGGKNIAFRESYLRAEAEVRSQMLQQKNLSNDLQKWYEDQNK